MNIALITALLACDPKQPEVTTADSGSASTSPTSTTAPLTFPQRDTVLLLTVDTLNERFLGLHHDEWDTSPNLDRLFDESVVLENTMTVRGATYVALPSLLTGTYPRHHQLRNYSNNLTMPAYPMMHELFQEAGYTTLGYSNNFCDPFLNTAIDERVCLWDDKSAGDQIERDALLVEWLGDSLQARLEDEKLFIWLHLMDPHSPYEERSPWYEEFHPEPYTGGKDLSDDGVLEAMMLGEDEMTTEDLAQMEAMYASQVRAVDELIGQLFETLDAVGRYDDALIVFGSDHGDELWAHNDYIFHACSPYDPVNNLTYSIRAPGALSPARVDDTVSITDIAPTMMTVAGLPWTTFADGQDLSSQLALGESIDTPVFFERSVETAGVVSGDYKYVLNPMETFQACIPYIGDDTLGFTSAAEELYNLATDPEETRNLAESEEAVRAELHDQLCDWVLEDVWTTQKADGSNILVETCRAG